jgi:hypothetical protein
MTHLIGKSSNTNDESNNLEISVDSTTATTLLPAQVPGDLTRIRVAVYHNGSSILWVRRYEAGTDNAKIGEPVMPGEKTILEVHDDIYTGEISAIFQSGPAENVYMVWY